MSAWIAPVLVEKGSMSFLYLEPAAGPAIATDTLRPFLIPSSMEGSAASVLACCATLRKADAHDAADEQISGLVFTGSNVFGSKVCLKNLKQNVSFPGKCASTSRISSKISSIQLQTSAQEEFAKVCLKKRGKK